MTEALSPPENFETLVEQYVRLRDTLKKADEDHKEKTKAARDYRDKLEAKLLAKLNDAGGESVKTREGTVYRTTRRNATVADGDTFRKFIIEQEAFDLVDWRANAPAIADFIEEEGAPPPGVNFSTAYTVGVRRA